MLFDVLGRGMSRPGIITDKALCLCLPDEYCIGSGVCLADEYRAIVERLEGQRPADYGITPCIHITSGRLYLHVRPGYTFDVRMVSRPYGPMQYGNGENLKTYFLSDGCTNMVIDGDEYFGISLYGTGQRFQGGRLLNACCSRKLPVTGKHRNYRHICRWGFGQYLCRVTAYAYDDKYAGINTAGQKGVVLFDDEIVCLGAGITSTATTDLYTTVNQCLLKEKPVTASVNDRITTLGMGDFSYENNLNWVCTMGWDICFRQAVVCLLPIVYRG